MEFWKQVAVAFSLVFVIEGIMPFLAPGHWRRMIRQVAEFDDQTLRVVGLFSMLVGLGLLYLIN